MSIMEPPRLRQIVFTAYGVHRVQLEDRTASTHYRIIVGGVGHLLNEWCRHNPCNFCNSRLPGGGYVHQGLTELGGDTRLRETM